MNPINDAAGTTPMVAVSLPLPSLIRAIVIALRAVGVQVAEDSDAQIAALVRAEVALASASNQINQRLIQADIARTRSMLTRSGRHNSESGSSRHNSDSDSSMFVSDTVSSRPTLGLTRPTEPIIISDTDTDCQLPGQPGPSTVPPKQRRTRAQTKKRQPCLCQFEFGKDEDGEVCHLAQNCPRKYE